MKIKTQEESSRKKLNQRCVKIGISLILLSVVLRLAAKEIPGFASWYAGKVYPIWVQTVGRISGAFPFSVVEFGLYGLLLGSVIYGVRNIKTPKILLSRAFLLVSTLLCIYTLNCGINYYSQPFSGYLDSEVRESSQEELFQMCSYLTDRVNKYAAQAGAVADIREYNKQGVLAMQELGGKYPRLSGYYPKPKALCFSEILSVQQLSGIYSPFTIEANYNCDMTSYNIPLTICHELSHLKGFMREDEANFIGYLACIGSESPQFVYSGYLLGWIYATNALVKTDREAYFMLQQKVDARVMADLQANGVFWNRYEGKVAEAANRVNDTYLKMNDQSEGVKSYGKVVDLMLAHYRMENHVESSQ